MHAFHLEHHMYFKPVLLPHQSTDSYLQYGREGHAIQRHPSPQTPHPSTRPDPKQFNSEQASVDIPERILVAFDLSFSD